MTVKKISSAFIYGLGAITDAELGFFVSEKKEYKKRKFSDNYELISLTGNITLLDNVPFPHIHVTLGTNDFQTISGHLFGAAVSVTVEIIIFSLPEPTTRFKDPNVGLNLIDLPEKI